MKKTGLRTTLTLIAFALVGGSVSAQKFGYINSQELIAAMPERDSAELKFTAYMKDIEEQLDVMRVELSTKYQDYQKNLSKYSDAIRGEKEKGLNELSQRIQSFEQTAQQDAAEQEQKLMSPVIEKATAAIKSVGKANGLLAVFDLSRGGLPYYDEANMVNILPLVKKELKIVDKPATAAGAAKPGGK
ncbi:MAG: OmpH family outer membrane protein [Rikenellaceae bacterium]|nr:OmpH family outer membrane protein [Rikenellaceae bacterium]